MSTVCLSHNKDGMEDNFEDCKHSHSGHHYKDYDGYMNQFVSGMRVFWATKHTEDTDKNRQLYIKTTVRELVIYMFFLTVLMIISFGMSNDLIYYYTNFINGLFTSGDSGSYSSARSVEDYWKFLTGPLMSGLYWNQWYNNMPVDSSKVNYIFHTNKLLGVPRLRQIRVRNDSCAIPSDFQNDIKLCYAAYSTSVESSDPFGLGNSTAWNFTSETKLNGRSSDGSIASYSGGGYYVDLNQTQSDSLNTINFLFNNYWIDRGTRAVILDFTVYNPNLNLFCVVKLLAEFPATGGMIPNSEFRTVRLIRYVNPIDYFVMACELIFIVFLIYYIVEEAIEIRKHKWSYFMSFWNCLDVVVIVMGLLSTFFNIYRSITVQNLLQNLLAQVTTYPNFDFISLLQLQFNYILALTLFLAWIKIFKYISFNRTMSQLNATLSRSATDLLGFAVLFFVVFIAFVQLAYLMFGTQAKDFSSFINTVFTLLRILLGDFTFVQLDQSNRILGSIFFVIYLFYSFFVLFTMFMAIIMDAFSEVKSELATEANEFEMVDYIKERANMMIAKLNFKRDRIIDIQAAMNFADTDNDNKIDFKEWKTEMKNRGYAEAEIEVVFNRYDTDGDRILDESERRQMQIELENQKAVLNSEISKTKETGSTETDQNGKEISEPGVSMEEHSILDSHINQMESSISLFVTKIDGVLHKLGKMEKSKSRRREALRQILDIMQFSDSLTDKDRRIRLEEIITEEVRKIDKESRRTKGNSKSGADF